MHKISYWQEKYIFPVFFISGKSCDDIKSSYRDVMPVFNGRFVAERQIFTSSSSQLSECFVIEKQQQLMRTIVQVILKLRIAKVIVQRRSNIK